MICVRSGYHAGIRSSVSFHRHPVTWAPVPRRRYSEGAGQFQLSTTIFRVLM